jgi:hypothetical protein
MRPHQLLPRGVRQSRSGGPLRRRQGRSKMSFALDVASSPRDRYHRERTRDSSEFAAFLWIESCLAVHLNLRKLIMADHLIRKTWGSWGTAIVAAVLALLLGAPTGAQADVAVSVPAVTVSVPAVTVSVPEVSVPVPAVSVPVSPAPVAVPAVSASVPAVSVSVPAVSVSVPVVRPPSPASPPPAAVSTAASAPPAASAGAPASSVQPGVVVSQSRGQVHARTTAGPRIRTSPARNAARRDRRHRPRPGTRRPAQPAATSNPVPWSDGVRAAAAVARKAAAAPHVRRDAHGPSRLAGRAESRPTRDAATTSPLVRLPVPSSLPPAGAEGAIGGGAAGTAGTGTAALLMLIALYGMRALLPGLLALELGRWRSALLVARLERPG